ncbi:MBL fold metallo-hydrolase [Desulfobotulus sp. H1]|uniref:MBL fold metallo-hydrolase n=1 Tax=Desulfobotulus pelophilus TaxID=2823377 RepID=A0ABT3N865_9BACT|nr:MBL fold metallo-hydrolase [Desulfobotulus pelophilus]MCW7753227.1 MBL fold metallo-hydrolase [Desulfobotulus pelophilus]
MIIRSLAVGPIMANCFIAGCEKTREAVVIDPGDEGDRILMALAEEKLTVKYILNTHGHFDHVAANRRLKEVTGAEICIHPDDAPMLGQLASMAMSFGLRAENSPPCDLPLRGGEEIRFGEEVLKVIHTPGHSPGGLSFAGDGFVFVGDTLFAGSIGRTDLPGGSYNTLIASIRERLFPLGDAVRVYCGHGPDTTIGSEKRFNPFAGGV